MKSKKQIEKKLREVRAVIAMGVDTSEDGKEQMLARAASEIVLMWVLDASEEEISPKHSALAKFRL